MSSQPEDKDAPVPSPGLPAQGSTDAPVPRDATPAPSTPAAPDAATVSADPPSVPAAPAESKEAAEASGGGERKPRRGRRRRPRKKKPAGEAASGAEASPKAEGEGQAPAKAEPKNRKKAKKKAESKSAPAGDRERRSGPKDARAAALAELEDLCEQASDIARRLFLSKPYSRDVTQALPECELGLAVNFRGRPAETRAQAKEIIDRLDGHIDDAILGLAAFRPGAVYSFFDETSEEAVCRPADPREIFCGYNETGLPQWQPLLSWAVDTGFEKVDALVKSRGAPVVVEMDREQLVGKRLESFGKKEGAYDLRGQVAIGYYGEGDDPARRFAVTMQVLISQTRSRSVRLGLNVLGALPDGGQAHALLGTRAPWSYVDLHRQAQRRLAAVNQELKRKPAGERRAFAEEEAVRLLGDLAQGGARRSRRANWRTDHARERARDKTRPTGMARNDVESVRHERIFRDAQDATVIVLGAKGRVHVFTPEGLHVTSLHLDRAALDQRMQRRRWQPMPPEELNVALAAIRARFDAASE